MRSALALTLVLAQVLVACGTAASRRESTPAFGPAGAAASPGAAATADPSPAPAATSSAPSSAIAGVAVTPLEDVRGDVIFVTRSASASSGGPVAELWAIPLAAGSSARVVVRYPGHGSPWLASRLSPDGSRYALAVDRGDGVRRIALADLRTGSVAWLRTDASTRHDGEPAWHPSGTRIAFARSSGRDPNGGGLHASVWVVDTDGTGLRELVPPASAPTYVHQWTPDGRAVAFYQGSGYDVVDVASGARAHMDRVVSADASWRRDPPHLVAHGWDAVAGGDQQYIFTSTDAGATREVVVRTASTREFVTTPRWRPGRDEFLYVRVDPAVQPPQPQLRVRALSGSERTLPVQGAFSPTWNVDGTVVLYVRHEVVQQPGAGEGGGTIGALVAAEIRAVDADGTNDRLIHRPTAASGQLPPSWCVCNDALAIRRY